MDVELDDIEFNVDSYREARLDQVIAHELHANFNIAEWLRSRSEGTARGSVIGKLMVGQH